MPVLAPMVDVKTVALAPKMRFLRPEERREARVKAAAGGGGSGETGPRRVGPLVSGRGPQVLVYLTEQDQLDVSDFDLLGL